MGCPSLLWKVSTDYHQWGMGEHPTTVGCFKQLWEWWAMTQWILCLPVLGSDNNMPMHHPSAKEVWFTYQQLRAELESISSTLKPTFLRKKIYVKH